MARTVELQRLRTDVRLWSDNRSASSASASITDTELTRLINLKLAEHHELLVMARGSDYPGGTATETISVTSGTASYALPATFFQAQALWLERGPNEREIVRFISAPAQIPRFDLSTWAPGTRKGARIVGNSLTFYPTPTETVTAKLRYVPAFQDLSADDDEYDGINGWEKLVTLGVAVEVLAIQRRPAQEIASLYAEQLARVRGVASERQAQDPLRIIDVEDDPTALHWPSSWY